MQCKLQPASTCLYLWYNMCSDPRTLYSWEGHVCTHPSSVLPLPPPPLYKQNVQITNDCMLACTYICMYIHAHVH